MHRSYAKAGLGKMTIHLRIVRSAALMLVAAGFLWSAGGGMLGLKKAQAQAQAPGPEVCAGCHEEKVKAFLATRHGTKTDPRTPINNGGCNVCHTGDTAKHVQEGGGKGVGGMMSLANKTIPQADKDKLCLSCHQSNPRRMHWLSSTHANRDTGCTSCHQIHTTHDNVRDKMTQPQVCFTCHKEQRVQINKPSRHPVLEGKVSLLGLPQRAWEQSEADGQAAASTRPATQCHMEKRGPFVHNHQPVTEDCTICHQPHGTTIAKLLKSRPPFLCQDCHATQGHPSQNAGLPTGRTTSTSRRLGTVGRGCLNCHTNIHGSNSTQNSATAGRFRR